VSRPVVDGAILEFRILQRMSGQTIMNVLHYKYSGAAATVVEGDSVAVIVRDQIFLDPGGIIPTLKTISNAAWAYEGLEFQWIHPTRYVSSRVNSLAGPGAAAGSPLPQNVHQTVTKRSIIASKHGVGSFHLTGMSIGDVILGSITAARITAITPIVVKMIEQVDVSAVEGALTMTPTILNKASPISSQNYNQVLIQNTVRVQRRRTVGVGI